MKKNYKDYIKFQSQLDLPFLETRHEDLGKIFKTLKTKFHLKRNSDQKLIDLGSGNGSVILFSALKYGIISIGIEIDEQLISEARERIKSLKNAKSIRKIKILKEDFFSHSLYSYDFIYTYSLPSIHKFMKHLFKTAKEGAIIISYKYPIILENILKEVYTEEKNETKIYFYEKL